MISGHAFPSRLVLVGAGKMGTAMLESWLRDGMPGPAITVIDPSPSHDLMAVCASHGAALNPGSVLPPDVMVLAVKPQMLDSVAPALVSFIGPQTVLLSILAGKTVRDLEMRFSNTRAIVRAMPNLPASVGKGATGAFAAKGVSSESRTMADVLLRSVGIVEWVDDERLIDAVTAVSGSGPAYVFYLVECLAAAGVAAGLPEELAGRLARQTVIGGGALLADSKLPAGTLRENVTSPGGTTAEALAVLMAGNGLSPLLKDAVAAAKRRAEELSG